MSWLNHILLKSAAELEQSGKTIFGFTRSIDRLLQEKPVQEWEIDRWARGIKCRLIRMEGYFFRIGIGKRSCLSFFLRNASGLYVGLRREAITQGATYVALITDYGYGRDRTCFETGWMDVAVFDGDGRALIYAENKASDRTLEKLCSRLRSEFMAAIPFPASDDSSVEDVIMKAQHIWRHKPRYFWGVSPSGQKPFGIAYGSCGFELRDIPRIPDRLEWN